MATGVEGEGASGYGSGTHEGGGEELLIDCLLLWSNFVIIEWTRDISPYIFPLLFAISGFINWNLLYSIFYGFNYTIEY